MAEEGAAKLRLKPRKAPAACSWEPSPGREPPRRRQEEEVKLSVVTGLPGLSCQLRENQDNLEVGTVINKYISLVTSRKSVTDRCPWFEKDDLNECEKTWILLMQDMGQDLQCTNWQMVPSFPEFLEKSSREESPQQEEVFTLGEKEFQWVSFPSFCKEKCLNLEDLHSQQLTQSQTDPVHNGEGQADELKSLPSPAEKAGCVTATAQAKTMVEEDTEDFSELGASPKSCEATQQTSSTHHSALSQSSAKAFSFQQHYRGTVQSRRENKKNDDRKQLQIQTHQGKISFGVPAEKPPVSTPGTGSCEEMENQGGGSSALESCPMCLMRFSGTLSQLDIDGHLARCLAESADDVMW